MLRALKKGDKLFLEPTLRSVEMIAGLSLMRQAGNAVEVGESALQGFKSARDGLERGRIPSTRTKRFVGAPPGWTYNHEFCRSCPQAMPCMQNGGSEEILLNGHFWEKCPILSPVTATVNNSGEYERSGELFHAPSYGMDKKIEEKVEFIENTRLLISRDKDIVDRAKRYEADGDPGWLTSQFTRPLNFQDEPREWDFDWSDESVSANKAILSAFAKESGQRNSIVAKMKREECKHCEYSCLPMNAYLAERILEGTWYSGKKIWSESPTVLTHHRCAVRQSELESVWTGSYTQMMCVAAHLVAGHEFDVGRSSLIVVGQDWDYEAHFRGQTEKRMRGVGGFLEVRKKSPPYDFVDNLSIQHDAEFLGVNEKELLEKVESLGDKLPLTFWALQELGRMYRGGETTLSNGSRMCRNDILYMKLELNTYGPTIDIGSDDRSGCYGGRMSGGGSRIPTYARPRYHTHYTYPYFKDIQKHTGHEPGGGR